MTPRVATVLSAREWEARLVAHARETAALRLVLRAYRPSDLDDHGSDLDAVVAGAETSWVTPARIGAWRADGMRVVGIHPVGDSPARARLVAGGADEVLADDAPSEAIARAIRLLTPPSPPSTPHARAHVTTVVGPRGAPGRTEIAVGIAHALGSATSTLLVDFDLAAPGLAIRLGLPPRPDVIDASDGVHSDGVIPAETIRDWNGISALVASHRSEDAVLRRGARQDLLAAAATRFRHVVVDAGPDAASSDATVLVVEGSPTGIVRAARLTDAWDGPVPTLVVNRVLREEAGDVVGAVRRWTGLDPAAVVLEDHRIRERARRGAPPPRSLARLAARLVEGA